MGQRQGAQALARLLRAQRLRQDSDREQGGDADTLLHEVLRDQV